MNLPDIIFLEKVFYRKKISQKEKLQKENIDQGKVIWQI